MDFCASCKISLGQGEVPIFSGLNDEELESLSSLIRHENYRKSDMIFSQGELANKLRIVHKGAIKLFSYTVDGKEQISDIVRVGDFTGEMDLFNDGLYSINGAAIEDSLICSIDRESIYNLILKKPEIAIKILSAMNKKMANLRGLAQNLATNSSQSRLVNMILSLYEDNNFNEEIDLQLSREDMANYCGLTRETVSRKLIELKREGLIDLAGNRKILIKNLEALKTYI